MSYSPFGCIRNGPIVVKNDKSVKRIKDFDALIDTLFNEDSEVTVSYVVTVHVFYGSAAEAADPQLTFGPYTQEQARKVRDFIHARFPDEEVLACVSKIDAVDPNTLVIIGRQVSEVLGLDDDDDDSEGVKVNVTDVNDMMKWLEGR